MADDVAAASDDLRALLRAYDGLLRWERELPRVLWMRHGRDGLGKHLRVPRVRLGLRWLLVDHMQRTLNRLRAELDARQMLGPDAVDTSDRAAVEACLRSLASIPRKRLSLFTAIAGVGLAHVLAMRNPAAEPLGHLTRNVAALSPDKVVSSLGEFNTPDKVAHAVLYLCIAFYTVLCVPMTAFRLKRILFNLGAERRKELRQVAACEHVTLSSGVYDLERRIAKRLNARHSFDETPLDLIVSAMLVVPTLWAIAAVFLINHDAGMGLTWTDLYLAAAGTQLLLLPLGRMAWIARVAAMRRRGVRPCPPAATEIPSRRRRLASGTVDAVAVLLLALVLGLAVTAAFPSAAIVVVLLAPTLGAVVYTGISFLTGATIGRRWTGLCVLDRDGSKARPIQIFARDVLLKWGVVNTLGFSLLWLHLPVIYLWPLWDPQRRTLYDLLADTVVVRAELAPAAELVPLASGP
jgi:uncharacterized RDD family membrane protein YckC